ncbi:MAG: FAD-dependent oxidoreductase [Chloroflexi bacterium]|nr:FAD-dependent oxidoreductase [Chloroflexota bacterium]
MEIFQGVGSREQGISGELEPITVSQYGATVLGVGDLIGGAPCRQACPVNTDAGLYASLVGRGHFSGAFDVARRPNPLVHICARVCGRPCELACRRGRLDSPVSIRALKRFVTDFARELPAPLTLAPMHQGQPAERLGPTPGNDGSRGDAPKVAIVGSGPAGLSAAHGLARAGHKVTIFEALPLPGGMLRYGIPEHRLPRRILGQELEPIWEAGVELKTDCSLGKDFSLDDLREDGYRAILLAIGAQQGNALGIEGENLYGVVSALDFLKGVAQGSRSATGQKVVVVGGGFTALDAARTARRVGAAEVCVVYRRSREQMPADPEEVGHAGEEGIAFSLQAAPVCIERGDDGCLCLRCVRTQAAGLGPQHRAMPVAVPDSEFAILANLVILATGQRPDLSGLDERIRVSQAGTIEVDPETLATTAAGIFAAGDAAFGPRLVIHAIADGLRAATVIERYLAGAEVESRASSRLTYVATPVSPSAVGRVPRHSVPALSPSQRHGHEEVELGYDARLATAEGRRCLQCFAHTVFEASRCILCGACVDVCPSGCLKIVSAERLIGHDERSVGVLERRRAEAHRAAGGSRATIPPGVAIIKDEERCTRCGLCAQRCPTEAIHLVSVRWKEAV